MLFFEEDTIELSTLNYIRFSYCSNCNSVFPITVHGRLSDTDFLCHECEQKLRTHHIVQCSNCQSIVNFMDLDKGEESIVFYVKKCRHCSGTEEDEKQLNFFSFPDLLI